MYLDGLLSVRYTEVTDLVLQILKAQYLFWVDWKKLVLR